MSGGQQIFRYGLAGNALFLAEDWESSSPSRSVDLEMPFLIRAELGVRPDHEVVHVCCEVPSTVATWLVRRAQEGTTAVAWPIGTPLAFVAQGAEPEGCITLNLAHPCSATSAELDLQGAFRRMKLDDEIIWERDLVFEPKAVIDSDQSVLEVHMQRGKEGSVVAAHAAGETLTFLAPGES